MRKLEGKVALVTGSSLGIGKGIILCFAKAGADVIINYRSHRDEAEEVAEEVRAIGQRAIICKADVASPDEIKDMFDEGVKAFGHIDIVVANAATHSKAPVLEADWDDVLRTINVTQLGTYATCQTAARLFVEQQKNNIPGGNIIIISSMVYYACPTDIAAYNMAKAGVSHFGKTLAGELTKYHINVNMIDPGFIRTPGELKFATEEDMDRVADKLGWGRLGTPEDIGKASVFLASDDADYITGASLLIDGGMTSE